LGCDVPDNVRLDISRRLERLDENEKRELAAAAVIGRSFSFQLLAGISQIDVDELFTIIEKAQQMGIIVQAPRGPGSRLPSRMKLRHPGMQKGRNLSVREESSGRKSGCTSVK
jgi:hypothetical protein